MVQDRKKNFRERMKKLQRYLQEESIKETSMELLLQCCLNGEMQNYHFTASELQVLCDLLVMTIKEINARIEMLRVRAEALPLLESQVVSDADVAKPVPMEAPKTEEGSHHQAAAATATTATTVVVDDDVCDAKVTKNP